jgi:hypothetical protein
MPFLFPEVSVFFVLFLYSVFEFFLRRFGRLMWKMKLEALFRRVFLMESIAASLLMDKLVSENQYDFSNINCRQWENIYALWGKEFNV